MYPETIGLWTARTIDTFSKINAVFVKVLTFSTALVLKPFGQKPYTERALVTEEEVKMLIKEGGKHGVFEPTEEKILQSIFEFTDMSAKEVMVPVTQMVAIRIEMSSEEILSRIEEEEFSRYPVFGRDPNDIRGILHAKDFLTTLAKTGKVDLRKIIKSPFFIPETMKISLLLREMQRKRSHMALVVDEYGGVAGLVTIEDLMEEIVGEIRDEHDTESPVINDRRWNPAHRGTDHRLGPPSKHPDTLLGPQIVIVDAMIEGIGKQGVTAKFQRRLHELRVFLSFVLGLNIAISKFEFRWVCDVNAQGNIMDCTLRQVGYVETAPTHGFPAAGSAPPIERRAVTRPGLGPYGITSDMHEEWVPADIEQLWDSFVRLPSPKREHLLRAGNAYLIAKSMWPNQRTAYAAFLVVTCEALKPTGKRYDRLNAYDVIASLVSASEAQRLRELSIHPQKVRP